MIPALHKLARLGPGDRSALILAYWYLLVAGWRIFVRRENLDPWLMNHAGVESAPSLTTQDRNTLRRRARWVNAAARHPRPWARCLQRSVALCLWMKRLNLQPQLKIGVRKEGPTLLAHAWVECGGEVVNDNPQTLQRYATLAGADQWPRFSGEREEHWT